MKWVLQKQSGRSAVVVKTDSPQYDAEDLGVLEWGPLAAEDVAALDALTEPRGQQDGRPSWGCAK